MVTPKLAGRFYRVGAADWRAISGGGGAGIIIDLVGSLWYFAGSRSVSVCPCGPLRFAPANPKESP